MKKGKILSLFVIILIVLLIPVLLAGCFDIREIDEMAYPLAIGLDKGEANILRISLQLAAPLAIGEGGGGESGGGGGGGESSSVITIDTPSLYSGLNLANNIVSKEMNLSHAEVLVISKEMAESGADMYLHAIHRSREFRPDLFVVISNGPAYEYLENVKPKLESNPSKYFELLLSKKFTSFYPNIRLNDFYYAFESDWIEPVAILSDIGKYNSADELKGNQEDIDNEGIILEGQYMAGEIPIAAERQNEVMGMAVFRNGKMIGTADGNEATCYHLLTGKYEYSYWSIPDPLNKGKLVVMNIQQRRKPYIKADLGDGKAKIKISIKLEGDFTSIQSNYNYEDNTDTITKAAEDLIKKQIITFLKRTTDEFDSDICGFGRYVKGKFLTWDSWKAFEWFDKYKHTAFDIDVELKVRRTGLMIRTVE